MARKPRFACLYMFLKHIFVLVFGTIPEHYSSALSIGAWRDECTMFGLCEPIVVLGLVACGFDLACLHVCACACEEQNWLSVLGLDWV